MGGYCMSMCRRDTVCLYICEAYVCPDVSSVRVQVYVYVHMHVNVIICVPSCLCVQSICGGVIIDMCTLLRVNTRALIHVSVCISIEEASSKPPSHFQLYPLSLRAPRDIKTDLQDKSV